MTWSVRGTLFGSEGRIVFAPSGSGKTHFVTAQCRYVVDGDDVIARTCGWPDPSWVLSPDKKKVEDSLCEVLYAYARFHPWVVVYTSLRFLDGPYRPGVLVRAFLPKLEDVISWRFDNRRPAQPTKERILGKWGSWKPWLDKHHLHVQSSLVWEDNVSVDEFCRAKCLF
jgi:hypothetical protein